MSTIINTAFLAGPSRSAPGQARIFLRRLIKQLAADAQWRTPPPISLPGRPVAVVVMKPVEPAPAPPVARVGYGPTLDCARGEVNKTEAEPSDFRGPYSYSRFLGM